jgi:glycosyltransferase involved in cell wall biosynthesis
MRICVSAFMVTTTPGMRLAGVGRHMFATLNQLTITDLGHQYDVFIRDDVEMPDSWKDCSWITWHPIRIRNSRDRIMWEHFKIGVVAKELKADIVLSLFLAVPFACKIPIVVFAHDAFPRTHGDWFPFRKRKILDWLTLTACKKSTAVVTVSEFSKSELARAYRISPKKIFVAPNGLGNDIRLLSPDELASVDIEKFMAENYILSVGTIEPRKNIEGLIRAFSILKADPQMKNIKLLIAGAKGWLDSSIGSVWSESRAKDDIEFLGYVSDLELNVLMQRARVFALTSFVEGFGIPPLEAMTVGTPIVVSNTSSLPEVCGDCAFYCDPASDQSICDALLSALTNTDEAKAKVLAGLERSSRFSWNDSVKKLEIALQFAVN